MNKLRQALIIVAAAIIAFASGPALGGRMPTRSPAEDRGHRLAARSCSTCHAIEATGESPNRAAPTFRDIARRYNAVSFKREFKSISEVGHFQMRPTPISQ